MTDFNWNDILQLPQDTLINNVRIPKTVFAKQANLTKKEQKVLDKVAHIEQFAVLKKANTYMAPVINDNYDVQSIAFLRCTMRDSQAFAEVANLIHKSIPNPTVVLIDTDYELFLSASITRKSQAEHNAVVLESISSSNHISRADKSQPLEDFYRALAYSKLSQENLLDFIGDLAWQIQLSRMASDLGYYPQCEIEDRPTLRSLVVKKNTFQSQINALVAQRRVSTISLNESAKLRVQEHKLRQEFDTVMNSIQRLCNH